MLYTQQWQEGKREILSAYLLVSKKLKFFIVNKNKLLLEICIIKCLNEDPFFNHSQV